jgi:hypothetical protein
MKRVAIVAAAWFAFWMILGAVVGGLRGGEHGEWQNAAYAGFFNGALLAVLTSFAWPWLMPRRIERWMYGGSEEPV